MYNSGILDYYLMWIINVEMYMDKLHFIVNPVAGGTRAIDKFGAVKGMLDDMRFPYTYEFTQCKGHGRELARAAAEHGEKYIIAVGGDGTVNEVASGLVGTDTVMGILPFGTGNDMVKVLGIPTEPREALNIILADRPRAMDAGYVNDKFFVNVSGFGFDVDVPLKHEKYKKRFKGMLPYLLGIVDALTHLRTLHLTLHDGERVWKKDALIVSVGNGAYIGGGMKATPFADPFDGLFEVSVVSSISRAKFLRLLPSFIKGEHTGLPEVEYFRTKELYVECPEECLINYDGELGSGMPVRYKIIPGAVKMLVQQDMTAANTEEK